MSILGVLTCEILELEFAELLATDKDVGRITVVENERSARLIAALESIKKDKLNRITHLKDFTPAPEIPLEVLVGVLELALHIRKRTLQQGLIEAARAFGPHVDAMMLG